jgi:hypothetical protein
VIFPHDVQTRFIDLPLQVFSMNPPSNLDRETLIAYSKTQAEVWATFAENLKALGDILGWIDYHVSNLPDAEPVLKPQRVKRWVVDIFPELETMTDVKLQIIDKFIEQRVQRELVIRKALE